MYMLYGTTLICARSPRGQKIRVCIKNAPYAKVGAGAAVMPATVMQWWWNGGAGAVRPRRDRGTKNPARDRVASRDIFGLTSANAARSCNERGLCA